MRIQKATTAEQQAYSGVYPLFGYVTHNGQRMAIEYPCENDGPKYEVMAPEGMHFYPDMTHSLLAVSQADLKARVAGNHLEPCDENC